MIDEDSSSSASSFSVVLRGSSRAKAKHGTAVDAWAGQVDQGSQAEEFCRLHSFNLSSQYAIRVYGNDEAWVCAKEWCHRMQFIFTLWFEHGSDGKTGFTPDAMTTYEETSEFTALAATATGALKARVATIRKLKPP